MNYGLVHRMVRLGGEGGVTEDLAVVGMECKA